MSSSSPSPEYTFNQAHGLAVKQNEALDRGDEDIANLYGDVVSNLVGREVFVDPVSETEPGIDAMTLLSPEQRIKAEETMTAMANKFGREKDDFSVLLGESEDGGPEFMVALTSPRGISMSVDPRESYSKFRSWNFINPEAYNPHFFVDISGSIVDTREAVTFERLQNIAELNPKISEWSWETGAHHKAGVSDAPSVRMEDGKAYEYRHHKGYGVAGMTFRPIVMLDNVEEAPKNEQLERAKALPTFDAMRPEPDALKRFAVAGVDIRQHSTLDHQDGVAFNPDTNSLVVCDGLGGDGVPGKFRDDFGWSLANSVAAMDDIRELQTAEGMSDTLKTARDIILGEGTTPGVTGIKSKKHEARSTIAGVQHLADKRWAAVTFGDSSIFVISDTGVVKAGFGESYEDWVLAGKPLNHPGVGDDMMDTSVGLTRGTLEPDKITRFYGPTFAEFEVEDGDRIVLASDAYIQKSSMATLLREIDQPADEWNALHSDDTTLAIIDPAVLVG